MKRPVPSYTYLPIVRLSPSTLFASILNEMFSSYVSLNSFTQLTVTGANTRVVYKWEPKSGNLNLI